MPPKRQPSKEDEDAEQRSTKARRTPSDTDAPSSPAGSPSKSGAKRSWTIEEEHQAVLMILAIHDANLKGRADFAKKLAASLGRTPMAVEKWMKRSLIPKLAQAAENLS